MREEIDRVDRLIVDLLKERTDYIRQAGLIKAGRDTVRDPWRIEDVITKVRSHVGKNPHEADLIECVYRHLIEQSIAYEFEVYDGRKEDA